MAIINSKYIKAIFLYLTLTISIVWQAFSQTEFQSDKLKDPGKYGKEISSQITTTEVFEYKKESSNCVFLKAGLRSSSFLNEKDWTTIKDSVEAYRVDIVYSKYPLRNGIYKEIYPLLFARLRALFEVDPYLNDTSVQFQKILQTNCINDDQVKNLFHGIVIWYRTSEETEESDQQLKQDAEVIPEKYQMFLNRTSVKDLEQVVENITSSPFFPDSVRESVEGRNLNEKTELIREFLEEAIKKDSDISLFTTPDEKRKEFEANLNHFMSRYGREDNVVAEVLDRHPEWKNMIVVNDWTGSMYWYGAQVLQWHLLNFEKSGITALTLFNDGDMKRDDLKEIGNTQGIYCDKADNVMRLVKLFNLVMLRGGGGDAPENDIEAILNAIEKYPDCSNVLLIADYYSCVRDILLADRIKVPVKIILCGYSADKPMNPDYIYLAKITGGGVYTIEEDIENIEAELGSSGVVVSCTDKRFGSGLMECFQDNELLIPDSLIEVEKNLKSAKKNSRKLDLSNSGLKRIPRKVLRNQNLTYLNLSNNKIKKMPSGIKKLINLKKLILSNNQLTEINDEISKLLYLERLEISGNMLTIVPASVLGMKFLTYLDLADNDITTIENKNNLKKIEYIDLSGNQIKALPRSFGSMKKLKTLDLSDNIIETIPVSLTGLTKLKELDLSGNRISVIPNQIKRLRRLKILNLEGNKLSEDEKAKVQRLLPNTKISF